MTAKEKRDIEKEKLIPLLGKMLYASGLEKFIPKTYVYITSNSLPNENHIAELCYHPEFHTYTILLTGELKNVDQWSASMAHEVGHMQVSLGGWKLQLAQMMCMLFFYFIPLGGIRGKFGKELFIESYITPCILARTMPALISMQTEDRKRFIEKRTPACLRKIICAFSDLLVSLSG